MTSLHTRLVAELDRLTRIAEATHPGPWQRPWPGLGDVTGPGPTEVCAADRPEDGDAIAAFASPDVALRGLEEDRDVLRRHQIIDNMTLSWSSWYCNACEESFPVPHCIEIESVARRRGITLKENR